VGKPVSENRWNVFVHDENIVDHRVHLRVPEQNRKIVAQNLFERVRLLMVRYRVILYLEQFVLYDDLRKKLDTVPVYLQVIHSDYRYDIVYYSSTKTYFRNELFTVEVHPVLEEVRLLR
jgi:hypothetical protein